MEQMQQEQKQEEIDFRNYVFFLHRTWTSAFERFIKENHIKKLKKVKVNTSIWYFQVDLMEEWSSSGNGTVRSLDELSALEKEIFDLQFKMLKMKPKKEKAVSK